MNTPFNSSAPNEGPAIVQPPRVALFSFAKGLPGNGNKLPVWYARTCLGCCWYEERADIAEKWGGKCHHPAMVAKYEVPQCMGLRYGKPHVTPESCPCLLAPDGWGEKIPTHAGAVSNG